MANSAAEAARHAFAGRLGELRKDARLNGRQLAAATGMSAPKVSRIENARQDISEDDIRAWAIACGAALQIPELIAAHREVEQMWTEHRREMRAGLPHVQARGTRRYEQTGLLRVYESFTLPGIVRTHAFNAAAFVTVASVHGRPVEEAESAADAREERRRLLTAPTGRNTYSFVIEAGALDNGFGGAQVMSDQFDFLIEISQMPHVAFGIIPPEPGRHIRPGPGFYVFDEHLVRSETWTGTVSTRRKDEIAFYVRIFRLLREMAVYGDAAHALIEQARSQLP